jgi:hypothetical protein
MAEQPSKQVLAARAAQKKYRETPNGRKKRLEGAARYRARHKAKLNDAVRLNNRIRKGCINPTNEKGSGPCQICGDEHETLHFDHNHATGLFRGWLCNLCNKGLGHFKDDPDRLLKAATYLKVTQNGR